MLYIKQVLKWILIEKIGSFLTCVSPKLNTVYCSFLYTRKIINLDEPKSFAEKISWLKLNRYSNDPFVKQCADKLRVREYVTSLGYGDTLNELIGVYDDTSQIPWNQLPNSFVLKWNFGSGFNYVCHTKAKANPQKVCKLLDNWGKKKFWLFISELQYNVDRKCILCERFLDNEGDALLDYKLYCFHGHVKAVLVMDKASDGRSRAVFMNPKWETLGYIERKYNNLCNPKRPKSLESMMDIAETLGKKIPFVRVDFYEWKSKPIFGEMTFTPDAGMRPSEIKIDGKEMGEYIILGKD